jgi:hypothetical protein
MKAMGSLVVLDPQLDRTEAIREFQNKWNLTVTGTDYFLMQMMRQFLRATWCLG